MSDNSGVIEVAKPQTELQPAKPRRVQKPKTEKDKKRQKERQEISLAAVEKWMATGKIKLRPVHLQMQAKVGQFIEQEGQHHISSTMLAEGAERLEESLEMCEKMWTEACEKNDLETKKEAFKWRLMILAELNVTAKNLNATRRKVDSGTESGLPQSPTMPARTEITNNTQIVVHPEPKPLP